MLFTTHETRKTLGTNEKVLVQVWQKMENRIMKKISFLACFLILTLQSGCYGNVGVSTSTMTGVPTQQIEPTSSVTDIPTQPLEPTPSNSLPTESQVPVYPPETRTKSQCLDVTSTPIHEIGSSGVLVLENRAFLDEGHYKPGTFHLDMQSGQVTEITLTSENQVGHVISPNRELVAYELVTYNSTSKIVKDELVVADAKGQPLSVVPWEEGWIEMPAWLDNERLVINASGLEESADDKPATLLVLNPFSGERQILKPDFPRILNVHATLSAILPFWDGWSGVIYDPTLTRAIYPRFIGDNDEMYTYAIWDPSQRQLVATLEEVFARFSMGADFPMPKWSPDGSRFVFQGFIATQDPPIKMELYEVSRAGQTRQLTQLSPVAYVSESSYSWSPDGQHIAMSLDPPFGAAYEKARVAVLDMATLNITDYCVNIAFSGGESPIWSPDGHQFVITDWYEKHLRVILVDIKKNIAIQIAEDMEPVGWMVSNP
jgi:hypothetical protein